MKKMCIVGMALCLFAVSVNAADYQFVNNWGGGDSSWADGDNWALTSDWTTGVTPGPTDTAYIEGSYGDCVVSAAGNEALYVNVTNYGGAAELIIDGGELHVVKGDGTWTQGDLFVSNYSAGGTLTVNSGLLEVDSILAVGLGAGLGNGVFNMNGGTVNVGFDPDDYGQLLIGPDGTGHLEISGGTINTAQLAINGWGGSNGSINFSGAGTIVTPDWQLTEIQGWIAGGQITNAQVELVGANAVITQVPEPATLALIGLGSLVLIKRRK